MATYIELRQLFNDGDLRNKVTTATVIAAYNILSAINATDDEKRFADQVFQSPDAKGNLVLKAVIAANKNLTIAQIQSATDAQIQAQVDEVLPNLIVPEPLQP